MTRRGYAHHLAFTLTEIMVAVLVLVIVIIGTAKIFGTASEVTRTGLATASMLQEAAAIEKHLRDDLSKMLHEGFLGIHCVEVRNDINRFFTPPNGSGDPSAPLLNPNLPPGAWLRCDQLVFFAKGVQSVSTYRQTQHDRHRAQSTISRVYYGHAFQLPNAPGAEAANGGVWAIEPPLYNPLNINVFYNALSPWFYGPQVPLRRIFFADDSANAAEYSPGPNLTNIFTARQPAATKWLLARQPIMLGKDGGSDSVYMEEVRSALTITDEVVRTGRVDFAAQTLDEILTAIKASGTGGSPVDWNDGSPGVPPVDQRDLIRRAFFYPRAERQAPSTHRVDQALTNHVISSGCSSFTVDWTFGLTTGAALPLTGFSIDPLRERPWFGMTPTVPDGRGVGRYADPDYQAAAGYLMAQTVRPLNVNDTINNIEMPTPNVPPSLQNYFRDYWAIFGFNNSRPLDPATGQPWAHPSPNAYTPWPSALRITMTLHDPHSRIEAGRTFQFVIDLPQPPR